MSIPTIPLTDAPQKLVENRRIFGGKDVEFSIYDTFQNASRVALDATNPLVCGKITGKKVIHAEGANSFDFLPGETLVIPAQKTVYIDFPTANKTNPTQCITVEIDPSKVHRILDDLNERFPRLAEHGEWKAPTEEGFLHFQNSEKVNSVMDQLIQCFTEDHPYKDLLIDLNTSRLVIHMLQNEAMQSIMSSKMGDSPLQAVVSFIKNNLDRSISTKELERVGCMSKSTLYRAFQQELGCSPSDFIRKERMKKAATLLKSGLDVTRCAMTLGYSSLAHFTRSFKAHFGITPNVFRRKPMANIA
jgi:AraC-like DNA-binding protein